MRLRYEVGFLISKAWRGLEPRVMRTINRLCKPYEEAKTAEYLRQIGDDA